jgi:hypothetical protein
LTSVRARPCSSCRQRRRRKPSARSSAALNTPAEAQQRRAPLQRGLGAADPPMARHAGGNTGDLTALEKFLIGRTI